MRHPWIICAIVCCLAFPCLGQEEALIRNLSLGEAIDEALKNNLDLQIEMTNPEIYQALLKKSNSIFIPAFTANVSLSETNKPSATKIEGSEINSGNSQSFSLNLSQKLALGSTFQVNWDSSRGFSSLQSSNFNPAYGSQLKFTFNQPLMKNFGTFVTKRSIYTSQNNEKKSLLTLQQRIIDLIYQVEEAYWNLVYAYQQLDIQKQSLALARDQLRQNEIQVKVGVSAQMDILTAQAEVASRESQLLQTQSTIILYEQNLRKILNLSQAKEKFIPSDTPSFQTVAVDFSQLLLDALEKRPDIMQSKLDLQNRHIEVRYSRNQLLPDLSINAQYYTTGVQKKEFWESSRDVVSNVYRNPSLTLSLAIPLGNDSARADYTQAQLGHKQALLTLKKVENTIYSDVKTAVMDLESKAKIIQANRVSRELQDQKLKAEQKKFEVGLSTNYLLLQFQRDLTQQQTAELQAIINYKLAIAKLSQVVGDTLEKHNLRMATFDQTLKD